MVEEQKIEERAQAVKRLRSLFDMHKVTFGSPVNLRGMLLNLHHDRHFSMDFWSVVNSFSEGGGNGSLSEDEMFEAVVESVTGVTSATMPAYEHPAVVELGQMIGGIDVLRPAAEPLEPVEPLAEDPLPHQEMLAKQPVSADRDPNAVDEPEIEDEDHESGDDHNRRRTIGEALARLEQTTRELREQLQQIDSQASVENAPGENVVAESSVSEQISPAAREPVTLREQKQETAPAPAPTVAEPIAVSEAATEDEDDDLTGSPLAEALPPHRFIDVVRSEPRPSAASMRAEEIRKTAPITARPEPVPPVGRAQQPIIVARQPVASRVAPAEFDPIDNEPLSSPLEQIRPPAGAAKPVAAASPAAPPAATAAPAPVAPVPPVAPAARVETEVFDPKPAHKLSQRGLAVPPPLDEDEINANPPSFGRYGAEPESSSKSGLVTVLLLLVLGAGAYAGSRTEQGQNLLANARHWAQNTYNSLAGHDDTSEAPATTESAPASQPSTPSADSSSSQTATAPQSTTPQSTTPQSTPTPVPSTPAASAPQPATTAPAQPEAREPEAPRQPRRQPFVDDSVLRVPSSAMTSSLISSRAPVYPPAAISQQVEGIVTLDVVIGNNGLVRFAKAIDGDRLLQAAAEEAVLRWRYKPYVLNGEPVSVSTTVQVRFKLPEE